MAIWGLIKTPACFKGPTGQASPKLAEEVAVREINYDARQEGWQTANYFEQITLNLSWYK